MKLASLTAELTTGNHQVQSKAYQQILSMAEQGSADAMYQVARCLRQGLGVASDEDRGDYWLRLACATTPASPLALYVLGTQHYLSQRPDSSPDLGLQMITQSAEAGFSVAVVKLSEIHETGNALAGPDLRAAYRVLASAIGERPEQATLKAYNSFVQRHSPISQLLDS